MLVEGPPEFRISVGTAAGIALPFAAIAVFLTTLVIRVHANKVETGDIGLIGESGVSRTPLTPDGKVYVHGEYWDATSSESVPEGTRVRVLAVDGLHLRVEPIR
jgi:membrane-bound serine protease (ClpP class)